MWKLFVIVYSLLLVGCKEPKPKPLDDVKNKNISINFTVDYRPSPYPLNAPVKPIEYFAGLHTNDSCSGSILKTPQVSDTYIQYNANELGLDTNFCRPMSYASVAVDTVESVTAMQTNLALAAANIRLNQRVWLQLLIEPYTGAE